MATGSVLEIVLRVKDEATAILSKIGGQAVSSFQRAASAAKAAFNAARGMSQLLADSFNVIEKVGRGIGKVFEILKKYAPDSADYLADVTRQQEQTIQHLVESINRLKAAGENLLLTVFSSFGDGLVQTLDSISVWVAKNKDDIARFIVDVGRWLVETFTAIGRFLGEMFRKIAQTFGADMRSEQEKDIDQRIKYVLGKIDEIGTKGRTLSSLYMLSVFDTQRIEEFERQLVVLRDLKKQVAAQGLFADAPTLPEFKARPTDKQMGVVRAISDKESAAIEASKKSWDELTKQMDALKASNIEKTIEYYDRLLDIQQGFIDIQKQREVAAGEALSDQMQKNLDDRVQSAEAIAQIEEDEAALADARLKHYIDGLTATARVMREERERIKAEVDQMNHAIAGSMSDSILNAFEAIVRGTMNVAQAFGTMVSQIMIDVGRMLAQKQLEKFLFGLVTSVGGSFGADGGNGPGSANFAARSAGGAGLAWGGPVQAGANYVVGERGAEIFRSSSSGSIAAPSMTINVNGAKDPVETARQIRNEVIRLATVDSSFRRRLQTV